MHPCIYCYQHQVEEEFDMCEECEASYEKELDTGCQPLNEKELT